MLIYKDGVIDELKTKYKQKDLKKMGLSGSTLDKLNKGVIVSGNTLDTLCRILNKQPGSIIKYVPDPVESE